MANTSGVQSRPRGLILADSYGENTNRRITERFNELGLEFLQIPPGTTGDLQPLDVSFFRQYKYPIKRIFYQLNFQGEVGRITDMYSLMM